MVRSTESIGPPTTLPTSIPDAAANDALSHVCERLNKGLTFHGDEKVTAGRATDRPGDRPVKPCRRGVAAGRDSGLTVTTSRRRRLAGAQNAVNIHYG